MGFVFVLVLLFGVCYSENAPSVQGVLTSHDRERLVQLFNSKDINSLEVAFYVSRGLAVLGDSNIKKKACDYVKQHAPSSTELQSVFYASSVGAQFSCDAPFKSFEKDLKQGLSAEHNVTELYHIVTSLNNIGSKVDEKLLSVKSLVELLEQEESISSYGQGFLIGAQLQDGNVDSLMELVEDVANQADETPTALYFEGGLEPTSTLITGIFELGKASNKRPTLSALQATLFSNYILSIRHTECVKDAYYLLMAAQALATNKFVTPVGLNRVNRKPLSIGNKNIEVRLVNVLGNNVDSNTVTLVSVTDINGKTTPTNKPFTASKDGSTYSFMLYGQIMHPGMYTVSLSTKPQSESAVPSLVDVKLSVTISYSLSVSSAEIAVLEKDQNVAVKTSSLQYPDTTKDVFSADHHSVVKMTFKLLNKETNSIVTVHQAFVQLVSSNGDDIFFVATPSSDGMYTFELDVAESAKESFGSKSGTYTMSLIVGGASVNNPFSWKFGSLNLKFPESSKTDVSEEIEYRYKPKPIIEHMFAAPEKRPPQVISMAFSVLVLVPLVLLLPIWLVMGANFSKIGLSGPWALVFHVGLAGIFMLYYCFWTCLNMFQTLQYLVLLGVVTFIAGNRMLKRIAKQ